MLKKILFLKFYCFSNVFTTIEKNHFPVDSAIQLSYNRPQEFYLRDLIVFIMQFISRDVFAIIWISCSKLYIQI